MSAGDLAGADLRRDATRAHHALPLPESIGRGRDPSRARRCAATETATADGADSAGSHRAAIGILKHNLQGNSRLSRDGPEASAR